MKIHDIKRKLLSITMILSVLASFVLIVACDQDEIFTEPTPPGGCDTVNVTYSVTIQNIMTSKCVSCHGNAGGVDLNGYANVKASVDNGKLQKSISPGGSMISLLSNCEAQKIIAWINKGAPNN